MVMALALSSVGLEAPLAARGPDSSAPASVDPAVARAAKALRAEGDIQTQMKDVPKETPREPAELPEWLKSLLGWLSGDGKDFVKALGWLLVAAAVLFVLYLTVPAFRELVNNRLARWRRKDEAADEDWDWRPDTQASRDLLIEAEALAEQGRYDEAVHLLLGRSLEEIARRKPDLIKPALTARAIGGMEEIPPAPRTAFATIATIVERGIWARRAVTQPDWHAARDAYGAFAYGESWRAAA